MMIVTVYLHQTDTERLQPCWIAAVHKNNASRGKDLILQLQRPTIPCCNYTAVPCGWGLPLQISWDLDKARLSAGMKAQDAGIKEGFLTKHASAEAKSRGGLGRAGKVPKEVSVQESLNGNLTVSGELGWRGRRGSNLITWLNHMEVVRYFNNKWQ